MGSKTKGWGSCVSWVWGPTPRKVTRASGAWALDPDPTGLCAPGDVTQNTQLSTDCPTYKSSLEEAGSAVSFQVSGPLHLHLCQNAAPSVYALESCGRCPAERGFASRIYFIKPSE